MLSVFEGVRKIGFKLRDMEYVINSNGGRELKSEGHRTRLRNDRKRANLLFGQLSNGSVGTNVVCTQEDLIADTEGWGQ